MDAFDYKSGCTDVRRKQFSGSEDCLYLDVFVPGKCSATNPTTKLPVMVFIYGGRFAIGSTHLYKPDFFLDTNVIIVNHQHREKTAHL